MTWSRLSFFICHSFVPRPLGENSVELNALAQTLPRAARIQPHTVSPMRNNPYRTNQCTGTSGGIKIARTSNPTTIRIAIYTFENTGANSVPCLAICVASGDATRLRNSSPFVCLKSRFWPTIPFVIDPPETDAIELTNALAFTSTRYINAPSTKSVARCPPPDMLTARLLTLAS